MTPSGCSSWARVLPVPCGSNGLRYAPKARFWRLRIDDARQTNTFTSQCQTKSNFAIVFIWGQFGLFLSRVEWLRACDFGVRVMSFIWIECFRLLLVSVFMAIVVDGGSEISFHLPLWASKYLQTGHRWKWSSGNSLVDHEKSPYDNWEGNRVSRSIREWRRQQRSDRQELGTASFYNGIDLQLGHKADRCKTCQWPICAKCGFQHPNCERPVQPKSIILYRLRLNCKSCNRTLWSACIVRVGGRLGLQLTVLMWGANSS